MEAKYHIIMADIISSSQIDKRKDFMKDFRKLIDQTNQNFKEKILSPLTITLGDEFQGVVADTITLIKMLFFMEEQIITKKYPFKLRYSAIYGEIDTEINTVIAHEMYGSGLTQAREALKTTKETGDNYFIDLNTPQDHQLELCLKLYQSIKSEWKTSEYDIIAAFLQYNDYKDLEKIGLYKTRSGAWKKRKSLRMEEYNIIKQLVFNIIGYA
ncbi:SatD family protein [Croceivirga thetidis]|uniref:SatD family (SatD) n=1 Tax=Croceivirga thetidis TaxID=2721623 RepID=A0ABX1GQU8_9FLAO|nr:SatD family protein [Croceivirga thetidis]NKI32289.1 hypothetical protein [Croceivirga thetidis]